jgi:hypothetical protein
VLLSLVLLVINLGNVDLFDGLVFTHA